MNKVLVSIVVLAMLGSVVPTAESQEFEIVPAPLPLSPETNVFSIYGTLETVGDPKNGCGITIRNMRGETSGNSYIFATNNPADPCRASAEGEDPGRFSILMNSNANSFRVSMIPNMAEGTPLIEGEPIEVKFTLVVLPVNPTLSVTVGSIQPKVALTSGGDLLGSWDEAPAVGIDTLNGPDPGGAAYYIDYEMTFEAPKALSGGLVNLTVSLPNSIGAESQELRRVATKVGFAIDDAHRGSITLPFAKNVGDFGTPSDEEGDDDSGNETANETDGGNTTGNETLPENTTAPTPSNTTAPSNNTTTEAPDEQGFLPGFEVAAVVSAALIAMAYVARERRRPPMTRGS